MSQRALILAAHGAGDGSPANALVRAIAEQLTATGRFAAVHAAFNLGRPGYADAMDNVAAGAVTVVPVMTSDGWFYETVLPRELARSPRFTELDVRVTAPVGTHPRIAEITLAQARDALRRFGVTQREATLVLVGHGTRRSRQSRATTERLREELARRRLFAGVEVAFLDDDPPVDELPRRIGPPHPLVFVPFLIGGGDHVTRDIPSQVGLAPPGDGKLPCGGDVDGRRIICADAVGASGELVEIILELATGVNGHAGD